MWFGTHQISVNCATYLSKRSIESKKQRIFSNAETKSATSEYRYRISSKGGTYDYLIKNQDQYSQISQHPIYFRFALCITSLPKIHASWNRVKLVATKWCIMQIMLKIKFWELQSLSKDVELNARHSFPLNKQWNFNSKKFCISQYNWCRWTI